MVTARTILVIDDDEDIRGSLKMVLEDSGYLVLTAADGQTGIKSALKNNPNLVIVDMMMPKMSGFVVIERIKQAKDSLIPVVMLTANDNEYQKAFAEVLGVDAFLHKPIGAKELLAQINKLCPVRDSQAIDCDHKTPDTAF